MSDMSEKLQILIPQFSETDKNIKPLLDSIALQTGIDFNQISVIIVNDGSDIKLSEDFLKSYPYKISYYQETHRGIAGTRNRLMDLATAPYIQYCDADDRFYSTIGIYMILSEIKKGFEMLSTTFVEESKRSDGTYLYLNRKSDGVFVHGKTFNLSFLKEHNIRWNENLPVHEDSNFVAQAFFLAKEPKYLDIAYYMWCSNDNSITRRDPMFAIKTFHYYVDGIADLIDKLENGGRHDKAVYYANFLPIQIYYEIMKPMWRIELSKEYKQILESKIGKFYNKYLKLYNEMDKKERISVSQDLRKHAIDAGLEDEPIGYLDWIDKIKSL